jgi:hypothetical protein
VKYCSYCGMDLGGNIALGGLTKFLIKVLV